MPLLPNVGRSSPKLRAVILFLYAVLMLGSVTMVYPFMLMVSGSVSSFYDYDEYRLVPRYLFNDEALFAKYLYEKNEIARLGYDYDRLGYDGDRDTAWLEKTTLDAPEPLASWLRDEEENELSLDRARLVRDDLNEFRRLVPDNWRYAHWNQQYNRIDTYVLFQDWLREHKTLDEVNSEWGLAVDGFDIVFPPGEDPQQHGFWPLDNHLTAAWSEYKREAMPADYVDLQSMNYAWYYYVRRMPVAPVAAPAPVGGASETQGYTKEIESASEYNHIFATDFAKISQIIFPRTQPEGEYAAYLWEQFVREWMPATMTQLRADAAAYQTFIQSKYASLDLYNEGHPDSQITDWTEIEPSLDPPADGRLRRDWQDFMAARAVIAEGTGGRASVYGDYYCRLEWIVPNIPEDAYANFLIERYHDIYDLNGAYGWNLASTAEVRFPNAIADMASFYDRRGELKRTFLFDNYGDVLSFILLHGRAMWNTLILVFLVVFTQLTVNPMAAYALSRFRLRFSSQILLFLLATMAFPAEVAMIPSFLMIKEMGLLNTYWALVLPGVANGFGIFLLKGFFDSLPPELYEAAIIDGASEMTMFYRITLPLSKPILAVLALGAFTAAYGEFMFAFLVCQKREMWTLMVFLYEFQQTASVPLVLTSLVLASIPTLLVFVFCQNIILRGIVIPSFK